EHETGEAVSDQNVEIQLDADLVQVEQEEILNEEQLVDFIVRKSSRESGIPGKFKDYVFDIPRKRKETSEGCSAYCFAVEILRGSDYYYEDYLASLNNVLREREPMNYGEAKDGEGFPTLVDPKVDVVLLFYVSCLLYN
ncbi:hypothetical protein SOVF_134960, partial [Spinacia oleracea]